MKKIYLLSFCSLLATPALAQMPYIEEVKALGSVSGQGMACGASKFDTYEMLARAIMLTKAPSPQTLNEAVYQYSESKANAYISKQMDGFYQCPAINERFDAQDIFKITLYADGTLKMPDGKIISPITAYDANQIYKADRNIQIKAKAIYDGAPGRTPNNGSAPKFESVKPNIVKPSQVSAPQPILSQERSAADEAEAAIPTETEIGHIRRRQ